MGTDLTENPALVLLSGGQDSATCLIWARETFDIVVALTFDYGQRHRREIDYARILTKRLGIEHLVVNMEWLGPLLGGALCDPAIPIETKGGYQDLPTTFVPGRNMILLSIAASIASARGIHRVVAGMCETDYSGYPDCRREFINAFEAAFGFAIHGNVTVHTPLMYLNKAQTFELAETLGGIRTIINYTMTCYEGNETMNEWGMGCGECPACMLRAKGFEKWKESQKTGPVDLGSIETQGQFPASS